MASDTELTGQSNPAPDAVANGGGQATDPFEKFTFKRDLDQIYLLLDHISTSVTKQLPLPEKNEKTGEMEDLIENISMISYPPTGSKALRGDQAATLIHALDRLNRAASPANCMTIAYTLLVAGEGPSNLPPWLIKTLTAIGLRSRTSAPAGAGPTRYDLAVGAFPNLRDRAIGFRWFRTLLVVGMIAFFAFTCVLSWNIATGSALLGQLNGLRSSRTDISRQIATAESGDSSKDSSAPTSAPAAVRDATVPNAGAQQNNRRAEFVAYCDRFRAEQRSSKQVEQTDTATGIPICDRKAAIALQYASAQHNLERWLNHTPLISFVWSVAFGSPLDASADGDCKAVLGAETAQMSQCRHDIEDQWAAMIIQIFGGAVLPIFYGLLGAGAAVVRGISAKIKESVLAPRDLMLSLVQLVLGAVIGGCIGLFITPAGAGAQGQPGLLGSVQLSASALCFIAGFGVEGVFVALETTIRRVFNVDDPAAHKTA